MTLCAFALAAAMVAGCGKGQKSEETAQETTQEAAPAAAMEPDYVTVQHILIGFEGSVPGKAITRTRDEADSLAHALFERAKSGEDFDAMVREFTDDQHPGIYKMANFGKPADSTQNVFARDGMVKAFGDASFPLPVGGVGLAVYDTAASKYGWHIVKRLE
jgi:parvulin-like peptidyl-prolyl isomerase